MKVVVVALFLVLSAANLHSQIPGTAAQSQKPSSLPRPHDSDHSPSEAAPVFKDGLLRTDFGFTSTYPADWQDQTPTLAIRVIKERKNMEGKLGYRKLECAKPVLRLSHGEPPSVISVVALAHSCTKSDFKSEESTFMFAAALGMCSNPPSNYVIRDTFQGAYKTYDSLFVIERSVGSPKDHPEVKVTLERVCGWLKRAEVFWQGELRDEEAVKVFEGALTSLDGEAPTPLVPASAIAKLHRPYTAQRPSDSPPTKSTAVPSAH